MNDSQYAQDKTANTDADPSPSVWRDCPWEQIRSGVKRGIAVMHDFETGGKITIPTTEAALVGLPLNGFGSSGSTLAYANVANDGGVLILAETTNQEGFILRDVSAPFQLSSNRSDFWFEARIKPLLIATNEMAFVVGLMDTTAASATVPLTMTTGAVADVNFVGFHKPVANTTAFDTSYKADGVTLVEVNSDVGTLVAATYVKLGMRYTARNKLLSFYINGVKQTSTKSLPNATGTDFPADVALGWVVGMCVGSAASDNELHVDYVRACQLI